MTDSKNEQSKPAFSIKLRAKNDTNGNPRRVFVIFDKEGQIIKAIDEGYRGNTFLVQYFKDAGVELVYGGVFDTTPSERRQLLKDFGNEALAKRKCEYHKGRSEGADCNNLPQGVFRSVCGPCKARQCLN